MELLRLLVIFGAFTLARSRPTTESTHSLLKRLGFDPVQRSQVNHHSKRVALETNKARYHNDAYSSSSDSRMFVVKLPPHSPYYSHMRPEKFQNEAAISVIEPPRSAERGGESGDSVSTSSKQPSFRTNGKPGQIYHWNIPILKRLAQEKRNTVKNLDEDSKVYRIKILPNNHAPVMDTKSDVTHKKNKRKNKNEDKMDGIKLNKVQKNKWYRLSDSSSGSNGFDKNSTEITTKIRGENKSQNYYNGASNKKVSDKYVNEVSKTKNRVRGPNYYLPALPKQNSFHKYFTGNGKLKSFYVIEKSLKPTRLHRLL